MVPGFSGTAPITHATPPEACAVSVHEDAEPEKNVVPSLLKTTVPVGGALDAASLTVAVQLVALPGAMDAGVQVTLVCVGSMRASTVTPDGPPASSSNPGRTSVTPAPAIVARPILPAVGSTQKRYLPSLATPVG